MFKLVYIYGKGYLDEGHPLEHGWGFWGHLKSWNWDGALNYTTKGIKKKKTNTRVQTCKGKIIIICRVKICLLNYRFKNSDNF